MSSMHRVQGQVNFFQCGLFCRYDLCKTCYDALSNGKRKTEDKFQIGDFTKMTFSRSVVEKKVSCQYCNRKYHERCLPHLVGDEPFACKHCLESRGEQQIQAITAKGMYIAIFSCFKVVKKQKLMMRTCANLYQSGPLFSKLKLFYTQDHF